VRGPEADLMRLEPKEDRLVVISEEEPAAQSAAQQA
jgi:hypothetical protein